MRRWIGIAAAAAVMAVPGIAPASHTPGSSGPNDFVTGGGHHSIPDTQFAISANSGPLGEDPKGQFSFKIDGQTRVHADVTCLIVTGNQAIATGIIQRPDADAGQLVVMHAVDNGEPGGPTPDLLRFSFTGFIVPAPGQPGCFLPVLPPVPVTQGNLTVHDATP